MRRWACVITLLVGFAGEGYGWSVRVRPPVAIERRLDPAAGSGGLERTLHWWLG